MGVWPDGYYVTTHQFGDTSSTEQGLYVFDRQRMLAGLSGEFQFHGFGESVPGTLIYLARAWPTSTASRRRPPVDPITSCSMPVPTSTARRFTAFTSGK